MARHASIGTAGVDNIICQSGYTSTVVATLNPAINYCYSRVRERASVGKILIGAERLRRALSTASKISTYSRSFRGRRAAVETSGEASKASFVVLAIPPAHAGPLINWFNLLLRECKILNLACGDCLREGINNPKFGGCGI